MKLRTLIPILLLALMFGTCSRLVSAQEIIEATKRGDVAAVRRILRANPQAIRFTDGDGATALSWAAALNRIEILQLLVNSGSNINYHQKNGWTPLISAAESGRVEAVEWLAKRGAYLEACSADGNEAIHFAARSGRQAVVGLLLSLGVDVDTPNRDGNTALAVAAWYGQIDVGNLLVAVGADIQIKNKMGKTARDEALRAGKSDFATMLDHYQSLLNDRAARDTFRREFGRKFRTSYAQWSDPNAQTNILYQNDFFKGVGPEWATYPMPGAQQAPLHVSRTPAGGRPFLGELGSQTARLTLNNLPEHEEIAVTCDLFILRSWDGNHASAGPDRWSLSVVDGPALLQTTFSIYGTGVKIQAFPGEFPGDHYMSREGAVENNSLGYEFPVEGKVTPMDAVFKIRYTLPHKGSTLQLDFAASGLEEISNESWGITNIEVSVPIAPPPIAKKPEPMPAAKKPETTSNSNAPKATPTKKASSPPRSTAKGGGTKAATTKKPPSKTTSDQPGERLHDKKTPPKP